MADMPRGARDALGGYCYHVMNRGNGRCTVFRKDRDFEAFINLLREAGERVDIRLLAFCLLPNHFHLALWPKKDGDLSAYMMWLSTAHVRRYHQHYHTTGHVWQGRFRSFPIQEDDHLLTVLRYIERNAVRANLVERAQNWRWCSLATQRDGFPLVTPSPVRHAVNWLRYVNRPQTEAEVEALRECIRRRRPYGDQAWTEATVRVMGLESSMRPPGRPPKKKGVGPELLGEIADEE